MNRRRFCYAIRNLMDMYENKAITFWEMHILFTRYLAKHWENAVGDPLP